MLHRAIVPVVVACVLVIACAGASFAIFPGNGPGLSSIGDGTLQVKLLHGWFGGQAAWYSCFATNDIRTAQTQGLTLAPKLASANFGGASRMFVVVNFNNQGPVFESSPVVGPYSGLWLVTYIRWLPGTQPWVICDASAVGPPRGLPTPGVQATYSVLPSGTPGPGLNTVLDCPIFAIGPLSNPWRKTNVFSPPYCYRIPQGRYVDTYNKLLTIPFWKVYCQDPITRRICVKKVIIPDVGVPFIQQLIGANYAPNLGGLDIPNRSDMWVISWDQMIPGNGLLKVLANQYPVLSDCPSDCSWRNTNYAYSPVFDMFLLDRNLALISPEVLFNNVPCIERAMQSGALLSAPGIPVNAPVICDAR